MKIIEVQKFENSNFYSQKELSKHLTRCLKKELAQKAKYQQKAAPTLNLTVEYKRVYVGEAFGRYNAVNRPILSYKYQIIENNKMLQHKQE